VNCGLRLKDRASAGRRCEVGRFKNRFERILLCHGLGFRRLALCARRPNANAIAVARLSWTPKRHQSGEIDYTGRISKIGDGSLRTALYDAAHIILPKPSKGCPQLKSWAMRIAAAPAQKAKVGLARRLKMIMHRMLAEGVPFNAAED
jgi:Transposase IS116/IS110/IS902 family